MIVVHGAHERAVAIREKNLEGRKLAAQHLCKLRGALSQHREYRLLSSGVEPVSPRGVGFLRAMRPLLQKTLATAASVRQRSDVVQSQVTRCKGSISGSRKSASRHSSVNHGRRRCPTRTTHADELPLVLSRAGVDDRTQFSGPTESDDRDRAVVRWFRHLLRPSLGLERDGMEGSPASDCRERVFSFD